MKACFICQDGLRPWLTKRNYQKWSVLIIDHLRREHKEVFPYLCLNELISSIDQPPVKRLLDIIYFNVTHSCYKFIDKFMYPFDIWIGLWEAYGDPNIPLFLEDILSLVTFVMVPSTLDEITHFDILVDSNDPIPSTDAPNSM